MISPKYLQTKNSYPNQINHNYLDSSQGTQSLNFLDQFKLKKPSINQYLKQKNSLLTSYTPAQKVNKQIHNPTQNLYTSPSPKHFITGNYFVHSLNYNNDDKNPNKIRSKDKSISHRSKKSPLRKIVKSQSHQMLYDPIQRVFKIIQQEQKARESQKLNQKTLKHLNFIPTFSELNDSFLNLAQNIKEIKTQKNFNQLKSFQKKKSTHDLILSSQYPNFENKKINKNQEFNKNRLNKAKSVQVLNYVVSRRNLDVKISGSKVKNYFSLKQENQKKNKTMRNLLENMGRRHIQENNLRKVNSDNEISQISLSQPSKLSNSNDMSRRNHVKNKIQVQPYEYSQSGQSQNYNESYSKEQSDYGFQIKSNPSKNSFKQKKFNKTEQRVKEQVPLDLKNMKMYVVDPKDIKKSPDFQVQFSHSQSVENYENSNPSIEEYIHSKQNNVPKSSYVSSKKSVNSESQKIHSSQASNSDYQPVQSVNTPAYRNGMQKKTQKSNIINEQKDDKVNLRKNFLSVSSKMSMSELIQIDSKINKKSYDSAKKLTLSAQKEERNFLKTPKIQSSSIINDLSNLIDDSSKHSLSKERHQVKKGQVKFQQRQNQTNYGNLKTTPKLSTVKDHEFSEFQIVKQSQNDLTLKANNEKRVDNSLQMSIESDLGLKSKRSIVEEEISVQKSHEIPIHSSVSVKSFKKSIGQQGFFQKKEESKKAIKFLKVTSKKNQPSIQPVKIEERIEQQRSQVGSKSQKSLRTKELFESVKSQKSSQKDSNIKQNKFQTESKQESQSNKSGQSNKSVEGSSFAQSSKKSSQSDSSKSNSIKKSQKISKREQQYSESSYSGSSHSRTLTKSVTNNLSKASSPHSISKSSLPNQNFKLQLHSKESQSLVDSSYNNSSQTSLSNSTSNNILRHSSKKGENFSKKDESLMFKKKKNFAQYTLNDVARLIQEHEFRIEAYCLYVDNSKSIYEQDYQLQKIQLLSFLMLKKSVYELNRAIDALNGKGSNVFCLTDIEIQDDPFEDYRERQQITQQRDNMVKSKKQTFQELKQTFLSYEKKYSGQKGFNLSLQKDDMSSQIVKKLSQQLNLLYEKWEQNKSNDHQLPKITKKLQKRMMEIIELIFLTSELDGQKVKGCELFSDTQTEIDFRSYYEKWFQKIIETIEYFDGRKSTNEQH